MTKASLLKRVACMAVFVAIAPQPAVAQEETIFLGVELSIGMDKSTVLGELRRLYDVKIPSVDGEPIDPPFYFVSPKESPPFIDYGQVAFDENDRLRRVLKVWDVNSKTDADLAMAVYGPFSSLTQRATDRAPVCAIWTNEDTSPELFVNGQSLGSRLLLQVVFSCGPQRRINITFSDQGGQQEAAVFEVLSLDGR